MTFSYELGSTSDNASQVRLLISDTDGTNYIFEDEEISVFLYMEGDVVPLAAAKALEVIAGNEVMVQKRIQILDLKTDGPAEATALLELADRFRSVWESTDTDADFEIVGVPVDEFSRRHIRWNQLLAGEL